MQTDTYSVTLRLKKTCSLSELAIGLKQICTLSQLTSRLVQTDTQSMTLRLKQICTLSEHTQTDANMYPLTQTKTNMQSLWTDTHTVANSHYLNRHIAWCKHIYSLNWHPDWCKQTLNLWHSDWSKMNSLWTDSDWCKHVPSHTQTNASIF